MSGMDIKKRIFPDIQIDKLDDLQFDEEGLWSITIPNEANKITNIIISYLSKKNSNIIPQYLTITDATAGLGGNVISFSEKFKQVNAIEIDKSRFAMLFNNTSIYNLSNIVLINDDYTNIIQNLRQDIVFIDPPWGGPDYKLKQKIELKLGNLKMDQIINKLEGKCKLVCLKLPYNYNIDTIVDSISFPIFQYRLKKMLFLIVDMM